MHFLAMRITRLPIPLVLAAVALTSVAVIYVYLTAPPMPIHTDPNFTTPLFVGGTYLWRGAAFEYLFSSDEIISISHMPPYHLLYTTGPLTNITIGDNIWIIYVYGERPLYVVKHRTYIPYVSPPGEYDTYYVFKLRAVTPPNLTISNLTMWLPTMFDLTDFLSDREYNALYGRVPVAHSCRALAIEVNGTHVIFRCAPLTAWGGAIEYVHYARLPSPTSGRTIRVTNTPTSSSYTIGGYTFSIIALPYRFFSITPSGTTNVVIYVN
jgi:hypothetical protein